ncbi:BamA/TamA family outer membrane protein [Carboxylicivirga mesophila]|uniref:BamA/TamA family outer membrane protein n=1 Tax=Carboxylicivirga mesophila TaxID=1166478 RepID=A0ABS5KD71_9BACT|nr:BamA/TamA family outer membrane protein [Carboxylicivirga mesophila]
MRKHILTPILFLFTVLTSTAQVDSLGNKILNNLDSLRFAEIERSSFKLMPYIAPSYTPETQFLLSGGGLITFKTHKDKILNLSSIPFSVGYSSNGSFSVRAINVIYWKGDKLRSIGEFQLRDMPDNYWGVGYDKANSVPKTDTTTAYSRNYWRFYQRFLVRTHEKIFVGLVVDINRTRAMDLNQLMLQDEDVLHDGTDIFNTGVGLEVSYDTRDFVQNAYNGVFISGIFTTYAKFLGGNTNYNIIDLDYRQYRAIQRERRTLAWQVKGRFTFSGNTPWTDKSMLGGLDNMRGYTMGRFRDDNMVFSTLEYRHMFKRKKLNKKGNYNSRFGYVAWVGAGSVAPSVNKLKDWLPNAGLGLRAELQPRMNIRVDYGWAKGENGVYITFAEVF